eukprot:751024-Hanusia_phi.AAC.2
MHQQRRQQYPRKPPALAQHVSLRQPYPHQSPADSMSSDRHDLSTSFQPQLLPSSSPAPYSSRVGGVCPS